MQSIPFQRKLRGPVDMLKGKAVGLHNNIIDIDRLEGRAHWAISTKS